MKIKNIYKRLEEIEESERKAWNNIPDCECSNPSVTWILATKTYGCNGCGNVFDSKGILTGNVKEAKNQSKRAERP